VAGRHPFAAARTSRASNCSPEGGAGGAIKKARQLTLNQLSDGVDWARTEGKAQNIMYQPSGRPHKALHNHVAAHLNYKSKVNQFVGRVLLQHPIVLLV
jgi:hypothetical protein